MLLYHANIIRKRTCEAVSKILHEAEREAASILSENGIEVTWVECRGTGLPSEISHAQLLRPNDPALRILPRAMAA